MVADSKAIAISKKIKLNSAQCVNMDFTYLINPFHAP